MIRRKPLPPLPKLPMQSQPKHRLPMRVPRRYRLLIRPPSLQPLKLKLLWRPCLKQHQRRHRLPRRRLLFHTPSKQHLSPSIPHLRPHQRRFRRQPRQLPRRQRRLKQQKRRLPPLLFRHPRPSRSQTSRLNRVQHKAKR